MRLFKKLFGTQKRVITEQASPPSPEPLSIKELSADALVALLQADSPVIVVDLRQTWEYNSGHIPGAINIPMMQLPARLTEIPKDQTVIMQCYHGVSSLDVSGYLITNGWDAEKVISLSGGISGWVASQGMEALAGAAD